MASKAWKAEVAGGETYMPWAKMVYSQGKAWGLPEVGIVSLLNKHGKLVMGVEKLEVIMEYMQKQWSVVNREVKHKFVFQKEVGEEGKKLLNDVVTWEEVYRMAKKLKRNKSPGSDLIPNEAWKNLGKLEYEWMAERFTAVLQGQETVPK